MTPSSIDITFEETTPPLLDIVRSGRAAKFVLYRSAPESDAVAASIFYVTKEHIARVEDLGLTNETFQGAGRIKDRKAKWDSMTCKDNGALRRDRPEQDAEADALLMEFQRHLDAVLGATLPS